MVGCSLGGKLGLTFGSHFALLFDTTFTEVSISRTKEQI